VDGPAHACPAIQPKTFIFWGIQDLFHSWTKHIGKQWDHVEKLCCYTFSVAVALILKKYIVDTSRLTRVFLSNTQFQKT
jgi:GH35 family endo-1,4-beta-xylanase